MKNKTGKRMALWLLGTVVLMIVIGTLLYQPMIRPWYIRWGSPSESIPA